MSARDLITLLPQYIDLENDEDEIRQIALVAMGNLIRALKLAMAEACLTSQCALNADNLDGSNKALKEARRLSKEYHFCMAQWKRLGGAEISRAAKAADDDDSETEEA